MASREVTSPETCADLLIHDLWAESIQPEIMKCCSAGLKLTVRKRNNRYMSTRYGHTGMKRNLHKKALRRERIRSRYDHNVEDPDHRVPTPPPPLLSQWRQVEIILKKYFPSPTHSDRRVNNQTIADLTKGGPLVNSLRWDPDPQPYRCHRLEFRMACFIVPKNQAPDPSFFS